MNYKEIVGEILKQVEHILIDEGATSQGVSITIELERDSVPMVSYEITNKAVI